MIDPNSFSPTGSTWCSIVFHVQTGYGTGLHLTSYLRLLWGPRMCRSRRYRAWSPTQHSGIGRFWEALEIQHIQPISCHRLCTLRSLRFLRSLGFPWLCGALRQRWSIRWCLQWVGSSHILRVAMSCILHTEGSHSVGGGIHGNSNGDGTNVMPFPQPQPAWSKVYSRKTRESRGMQGCHCAVVSGQQGLTWPDMIYIYICMKTLSSSSGLEWLRSCIVSHSPCLGADWNERQIGPTAGALSRDVLADLSHRRCVQACSKQWSCLQLSKPDKDVVWSRVALRFFGSLLLCIVRPHLIEEASETKSGVRCRWQLAAFSFKMWDERRMRAILIPTHWLTMMR